MSSRQADSVSGNEEVVDGTEAAVGQNRDEMAGEFMEGQDGVVGGVPEVNEGGHAAVEDRQDGGLMEAEGEAASRVPEGGVGAPGVVAGAEPVEDDHDDIDAAVVDARASIFEALRNIASKEYSDKELQEFLYDLDIDCEAFMRVVNKIMIYKHPGF